MNTYKKIIFAILLIPFMSCSEWLNLKPENQATDSQLFAIGEGYRTVLNGLYKKMGEEPLYGVQLQFGIIDCVSLQYDLNSNSYVSAVEAKYLAAQSFDYTNIELQPDIKSIWLNGYNIIANANNLIQTIKDEDVNKFELGKMERDMILGEAYACRALLHFDLLRMFAPAVINDDGKTYIPYVDVYPNIQANGITVKEYLKKVISDLELASNLTLNYDSTSLAQCHNASGNARFYDKLEYGWPNLEIKTNDFFIGRGYRLNYYSITALQARVYQYANMHDEAFAAADKVLKFKAVAPNGNSYEMYSNENFDGFSWQDNPENFTDLKTVSSLIFGVYNGKAYESNKLNNFFAKKGDGIKRGCWLQFDIKNQKFFNNSQTPSLDESKKDIRHNKLIFYVDGTIPISAKWYLSDNTIIRDDNVTIMPIIRSVEMRYIMAECHARKGEFEQAYQIINDLRNKRSTDPWGGEALEPYKVQFNMELFTADFMNEARREWLGEGQLFYLYKRLNTKITMKDGTIRPLSRNEYLFPIPTDQNS